MMAWEEIVTEEGGAKQGWEHLLDDKNNPL
jgi:hypothetical protein